MMEKEKKKGHSLLRILGVTGPYTKFQKLPVTVTLLFATKCRPTLSQAKKPRSPGVTHVALALQDPETQSSRAPQ